nr:N-acetyltransferase [uncultured Pseudodesulfovibrio sp.]
MNLTIRTATEADRDSVYRVESQAFGYDKEAKLVDSLLGDSTAEPCVSLLAFEKDQVVGHILFTAGRIEGSERKISLLAPLSVVPDSQGKGVGGKLIDAGLKLLAEMGIELVFVLGHPGYYPKFGFTPAHPYGLNAPFPIPEKHADAWMVQALNDTELCSVRGTVVCADALNKPEHWRE